MEPKKNLKDNKINESKLSQETLEAIAETEYIMAHPEEFKGYTDIKEMFADLGIEI